MSTRLDVAVLLDGDALQRWQYRALRATAERTDAGVDLVVRRSDAGADGRSLPERLRSPWATYRLAQSVLAPCPALERMRAPIDAEDCVLFEDAERRECAPVPADGLGNELPAAVVDRLSECDVAVRFGFGVLVGDALDAPRLGVLSFHHGDLAAYRGRPAGFWELRDGVDEVGITLQRLTETLDGGHVVARDAVPVEPASSWPAVMAALLSASTPLLVEGVRALAEDGAAPTPTDSLGELYGRPGWLDVGQYLLGRWRALAGRR